MLAVQVEVGCAPQMPDFAIGHIRSMLEFQHLRASIPVHGEAEPAMKRMLVLHRFTISLCSPRIDRAFDSGSDRVENIFEA
ncbi:MAG: hypothetical protein DI597_16755 [Pseudoxanthomonas spadix]|nr:MAG: hypothetical protein DI597_16755 [Pseudoxanthomonas spadix]